MFVLQSSLFMRKLKLDFILSPRKNPCDTNYQFSTLNQSGIILTHALSSSRSGRVTLSFKPSFKGKSAALLSATEISFHNKICQVF